MDRSSSGIGRKKLKHRLAAILSVFSRRSGSGRKRRDEDAAPPPLALPSYGRFGRKAAGGDHHDRRLSVSARRTVPLIRITIDCAGRRSVDAADPSLLLAPLDADDDAAIRNGTFETSEWEGRKCPPSSPFPMAPLPPLPRWKERPAGARRPSTRDSSRRLLSSSSSDDEYDEDSRNLFSSRSFSSDSSDFYNCPLKGAAKARASVSGPCRAPPAGPRRGASQSCRYSFEMPRGSTASAATDGGFAVVKRSADPYEDFRKSMEEMIADDQGQGEHSAESLLETYLVLNSPRHYPVILAAFADVRETLCP